MSYHLVKYRDIWEDEIYVEGFALAKEEYKEFFDSLTDEDFPLTHVLGYNQSIKYQNISELVKCYTWTLLEDSEYLTISQLLGSDFGCFYFPDPDSEDNQEI
jgi:hypothetical protein